MIKRLLILLTSLVVLSLGFSPGQAQESLPPAEGDVNLYLPFISTQISHDWIGPDGGLIAAVVIDPQMPSIVYAGSWGGGVYKSVDGGATWSRASQGLLNQVVVSMAIDPLYPSTLYAGTYEGGVYKSTDGAHTWRPVNSGIQPQAIVYSIAVNPQDTQTLFIATRGASNNDTQPWLGIVYRSQDGGESWIPSLSNLGGEDYQDYVYALEIDPNQPHIIFGATHEHGPIRSQDSGQTWKVLTWGITNRSTRAVVVDPRLNLDIVYTGVWTKSGVFKSTDGGDQWELKNDGLSGANIYGLAIDPFAPKTLYAATFNMGVRKTVDGANTWFSSGLTEDSIATLRVNPANGQTVFAGTAGDGLYLSWDGGQTWGHRQKNLTASAVTSLVVSPIYPDRYYASLDGGGVVRSDDQGMNWSPFSRNLYDKVIHALVLNPVSHTLFALTDVHGLYACNLDNSAACWQAIDLNLPSPTTLTDPLPEGETIESRDAFFSTFQGVPSIDSPQAVNARVALLSMAFAPSDAQVVYLGTEGAGIYKSLDGGSRWVRTAWTSQVVGSMAVQPGNPEVLYAASDQPGLIGVSQDGGDSWGNIGLPGVKAYSLVIPPADPEALLAGTGDGVYRYSGGAWSQLGLPGERVIALAVPPEHQDLIVAGTASGVMLSRDGGQTWQPGPSELNGVTVQGISFTPFSSRLAFYLTPAMGALRAPLDE